MYSWFCPGFVEVEKTLREEVPCTDLYSFTILNSAHYKGPHSLTDVSFLCMRVYTESAVSCLAVSEKY